MYYHHDCHLTCSNVLSLICIVKIYWSSYVLVYSCTYGDHSNNNHNNSSHSNCSNHNDNHNEKNGVHLTRDHGKIYPELP